MRRHAKVLFAVAMLFSLFALGAVVQAAQVYVPAQSFSGPGSADGELNAPRRAAVEQSTGNLFVADSGNGRVQVFAAAGSFLASFGQGELDAPYGIAIDESGGQTEVYVSDPATNQILRYDSDEAATPSFTIDPSFTSPAAGAGQLKVGDFAAALAVDPNNGDLWVADPGDDRAQRYSDTGTFELANDGSDSPGGAFAGLLDIAADSAGRLYAVDADGPIANQPDGTPAGGQSRVERFSAGGEHQLTLAGLTQPATVAVDLATDRVAVSADQNNVDYNGEPSLHVFDSSGAKLDELRMGPATQYTTVHGLAWRSSDADVLAVTDFGYWGGSPLGVPSINRFELAEEPTAAIDPVAPGTATATSAELTGTVNPGGRTTTAHFELSTDGGSSWKELDEIPVCEVSSPGDCTGDEAVVFNATGLVPNTIYSVRLGVQSTAATATSAIEEFTTDAAPPAAETGGAALRTQESARLAGEVNPFGLPTTYYFEYGTSPGTYTTSVPASEDGAAGSGRDAVTVKENLTGLAAATTYYFRLVASNAEGTSTGVERSFTTLGTGQVMPDVYFPTGSFGETPGGGWGSGPGQLNSPRRLAVDGDSGQIYVADQGNGRIQVFAPDGNSASYLTEFGAGILSAPYGIAIDRASGDVYVADEGAAKIFKFNSDGASTPTFTLDPGFTSPAQGSGPGELASFAVDLEVDASSGELVVADSGNQRVQRFAPDGTAVPAGTFNGAGSPRGPFSAVGDIAVDANGDVIVVTLNGDARVERYTASGDFVQAIPFDAPPEGAGLVEIDPNTGYVLVGIEYGWFVDERILVFDGIEQIADVRLPDERATSLSGFDVRLGGDRRLYVVADLLFGCCGLTSGFVYVPGVAATASLDPVSGIGATTATFQGTVNPRGTRASYRFEYSGDGGAHWAATPYPYGDAGEGSAGISVEATADDLVPGTEYQVRLIVTNGAGKVVTATETFTTGAGAPTVGGLGAAPRTTTGARVNARVNPNGQATTYYFEYGSDTDYGSTVPASQDGDAGAGTSTLVVSRELTGLEPGAEYHYRLVATNATGTAVGPDTTFRTRTAAEAALPRRGIEMVNQPNKGNQDPGDLRLDASGDHVLWGTVAGAPGSPLGVGFYRSSRTLTTTQGWTTRNVIPPRESLPAGVSGMNVMGATADFSRVLIRTFDGDGGFSFLRTNPDGSGEILEDVPIENSNAFVGVTSSPDMSHVYYPSNAPIHPKAPSGDRRLIYDFGVDPPTMESPLPDGSVPQCGVFFTDAFLRFEPASDDSSKLFFSTPPGTNCSVPRQLFRRDVATGETVRVSPPPVRGRDREVEFIRANPSGERVIFASAAALTASDVNDHRDVYRWDRQGGVICLTCIVPDADVIGPVFPSKDLDRIYFTAAARLTDDARPSGPGLYLWRDGAILYVAPVAGELSETMLSDDGGTFVWHSTIAGVTSDEPGPNSQYYLYDADGDSIECVSCSGLGSASNGPTRGASGAGSAWSANLRRSGLTADGSSLVFITSGRLLPRDVNGRQDVYEWHNGSLQLVTDGVTAYPSVDFAGISNRGETILFRAAAGALTGFEEDRLSQLYAARADGGIRAPLPPQPCEADDCQGPLVAPPPLTPSGSSQFSGPNNQTQSQVKKRCNVKKVKKKRGKVKARCGKRKQGRGGK